MPKGNRAHTINGAKRLDRGKTMSQQSQWHAYQEIEEELHLIEELLHRLLEKRVEEAGPFDVLGYLNRNDA